VSPAAAAEEFRSPSLLEGSIAATTSSSTGFGAVFGISRTDFDAVAGIDFLTVGRLGFGATLAFGLTALANPGFAAAIGFATGFAGKAFGIAVFSETGLAAAGFGAFASFDSSSVTLASAFASFCLVFESFAFSFFFFIT
jgi:hypothetical protein